MDKSYQYLYITDLYTNFLGFTNEDVGRELPKPVTDSLMADQFSCGVRFHQWFVQY